jgi:hypothetical protein
MKRYKIPKIFVLLLLLAPMIPARAIALDLIFDPPVAYPVGDGPFSVHAGDFDGDGNADLAIANYASNNISILMNEGDGTFAAPIHYGVGNRPTCVEVSDLDGDNYVDLIVTNRDDGTISILNNNGNGTFAAPVNYGSWNRPGTVCTADFNGDGEPDLAVGHDGVAILINQGDGTFVPPVNYGTGGFASCVIASDFNGDGTTDLAVTKWGVQPDIPNNVSVLMNNGDGTFAYAVPYESWLDPSYVCAADFAGDESPDLAVTHAFGVSTLRNYGDGTFDDAIDYAIGYNPRSILAVDFDLDDRPDLAVANSYAAAISILLNNGDGIFADAINYEDYSDPFSVFADDFNNDGKPDLAVADFSADSVSVFINRSTYPNDADWSQWTIYPMDFQLNPNYPNPFNPATRIEYYLPRASTVKLTIYNILGQAVKSLVNERQEGGYYYTIWDGKNRNGYYVPSGVYLYHLEAGTFSESKKMLLLK